jgi:hypothetical protein
MDDFPAPALPGSGLALVPALTKLNFVTWIYGTPISAIGLSACIRRTPKTRSVEVVVLAQA